jgi:hypothetical protein
MLFQAASQHELDQLANCSDWELEISVCPSLQHLTRDQSFFAAAYFLGFAASASSISRRIASEREGLSFCCLAQFSMANRVLGGSRTVSTGSRPVAGRPGLFGVTFSLDDFAMFW